MRVLITGVAGFIGSNLAERLLRENERKGRVLVRYISWVSMT